LCLRTFALFILRTLLNAIICCSQLNTQEILGRFPASGFLVIDAVGWRSMYFVVMPRVSLRASLAKSPARPPAPCFFIRMAKIGPVAPPIPRFCPDLGLHPFGEPRPSPAFRGVLGDSGRKKCVRNGEETSRTSCGPDLSAREIGRRPHRLIFRASLSSPRIAFRVL
jgi:hypothetical protein